MSAGTMAFSAAVLSRTAMAQAGGTLCNGDPNTPLEGQISANHGHRLLIPRQDVLAGKDKMYDIQGAASHGHTVLVTQEMFAQLRTKGQVQITSSATTHSHIVTLVCQS
jgi:hypothetical protein